MKIYEDSNLNGRKRLDIHTALGTRYGPSRAPLTLIAKPESLACWLLCNAHKSPPLGFKLRVHTGKRRSGGQHVGDSLNIFNQSCSWAWAPLLLLWLCHVLWVMLNDVNCVINQPDYESQKSKKRGVPYLCRWCASRLLLKQIPKIAIV